MCGAVKNVCQPLPLALTSTALPSETREAYVIRYLEEVLPSSDSKDVLDELKRTFLFDKHKLPSGRTTLKNRRSGIYQPRGKLKVISTGHRLQYTQLEPLHDLWVDYMKKLLNLKDFGRMPRSPVKPSWDSVSEKLLRADFHGAKITVVKSKCPEAIGSHGIILLESKNCFRILTKENRIKTLVKDSSVFRFELPGMTMEAPGCQMHHKPAERSVKKLKTSNMRFHL